MRRKRRITQYLTALLVNSYWLFFWKSSIYQGQTKTLCFPGLNCYSCPAAVMACPLGALQNILTTLRANWANAAVPNFGAYVIGSIGLFGSFLGRFPCGWLCPFGLVQEVFFKITSKKRTLFRASRYLPYFFLAVFVILLPILWLDDFGYGLPTFCKFICPAGTLEAGIPLLLMDPGLRRSAGMLFVFKLGLLFVILGASTFFSRFFCRTICPLGAFLGLFNRVSLLQLYFQKEKCMQCGACLKICPVDLSFYNETDRIDSTACIRCLKCYTICPADAITLSFGKISREGAVNKRSKESTA